MLIDTNVLIRTLQPHHPLYGVADRAIQILPRQGHSLQILPQILIELWVVVTRPPAYNGLGMTPDSARAELERLKSIFVLLPEIPAIYPAWESLVDQYQVSGKAAHDARLVAAMQAHDVTSILTFNGSEFKRYANIEVIDPADVVKSAG